MTRKILTFIFITLLLQSLLPLSAQADSNPPLLITEVQTGRIDNSNTEFTKDEFIELLNPSSAAINVTNWQVQYLSAASNGTGTPTAIVSTLDGWAVGNGPILLAHANYAPYPFIDVVFGDNDISSSGVLAKSGGHIRVVDAVGGTIDCVAWGSATTIAGCDKVSTVAPAGYSLQRPLNNGHYDKSLGVTNLSPATPTGGGLMHHDPADLDDPGDPGDPVPTVDPCDNVLLSEILPNPAGDDAAGEYIELYNPTTHVQSLFGCSLRLGNGKQFTFSVDDSLLPLEYKAYPYSTTGLQLTNSGSEVDLVTSVQTLSTTYPSSGDNEAWALIDGVWQTTKLPTPNFANTLPMEDGAVDNLTSGADELAPCAAGKYRNPDTGRCKNIVVTSTTNCPAGQERNPDTNRCRKITTPTSTSCPTGQQRNPSTNRCRKIVVPAAAKSCPAGQERNAQTNRCRKTVAAVAKSTTSDAINMVSHNYWIIALVLVPASAYAIYEYRQDFANWGRRLRGRFQRDMLE